MNINYELIGLRIRQIRKEQDLSQEELAELSDVSARFISMIETGRKMPSLKVLCEIAEALGISLDEIVFGEVKTHPKPDEWMGDTAKRLYEFRKRHHY